VWTEARRQQHGELLSIVQYLQAASISSADFCLCLLHLILVVPSLLTTASCKAMQ
jgi:hypothetical protein